MRCLECHTERVPTTRNRLWITETDPLEKALDKAARQWPEERSRARLLVRLALFGSEHLDAGHEPAQEARRAAVMLAGCYSESYLRDLRADWPA